MVMLGTPKPDRVIQAAGGEGLAGPCAHPDQLQVRTSPVTHRDRGHRRAVCQLPGKEESQAGRTGAGVGAQQTEEEL